MGCGKKTPDDDRVRVRIGDDELYLAPATESEARVRGVLPNKGSEDVSGLLTVPRPQTSAATEGKERDYLPDPETDWVIDVRFEGEPRLEPQQVSALFNAAWRKRHGSMTIYGLDADTGRWTFLISADGPKQVTRLKLAWEYINPVDESPMIPSSEVFAARRDAVLKAFSSLGKPTWEMSLPPEQATERARLLRDFKRNHDFSPVLVLRAPAGGSFEGRAVWDVMLCLGLQWGDMDIFHWPNSDAVGDNYFFSVWTSTPPGYFLPERIAGGKLHVGDLVFGYSAPRCACPSEVFESMVRAVEYARKRLGGTIVNEEGGKADLEVVRRKLRTLEQEMKKHGLEPGGDSALHLF